MAVEDYRELLDEELRANVYGTGVCFRLIEWK